MRDAAPDAMRDDATAELRDGTEGQDELVRAFALTVLEGPDAGRTFSSRGARTVIGTHKSAELVLADRTVSRFHFEIALEEGRASLRDLDSRNGTLIDGVSVLAARLANGSVISAGKTRLRFELGETKVRVRLSARDRFGDLVGRSVAARRMFAVLEAAARSDATVLLQGETGSGKDAAAEAIHRESARADGPLVAVDCGAIPPNLLESELFGHEAGAFTGAIGARRGAFEAASKGTIFLDEIGELGAELQPKLLRAIEKREVKRVGADTAIPIDVRVIAATNRDLRAEVNARTFRSDLYYRLAVIEIFVPPLRDRLEDLPSIVELLVSRLAPGDAEAAQRFREKELLAELRRHAWPGNIRELRNYLERSLALHEHPQLAAVPVGALAAAASTATAGSAERKPYRLALRDFERQYLIDILAEHGDNVTAAAQAARVDRIQFYRMLWRNGLR